MILKKGAEMLLQSVMALFLKKKKKGSETLSGPVAELKVLSLKLKISFVPK